MGSSSRRVARSRRWTTELGEMNVRTCSRASSSCLSPRPWPRSHSRGGTKRSARGGSVAGSPSRGRKDLAVFSSARGFGLGTGTQKSSRIPPGFKKVAELDDLEGKASKAVVLGTLNLILFSYEGEVYCTEANSTAFQFPLMDGVVAIETPLDGTTYNLATGEVIEWCPRNNLLRELLGRLKENEKPKALKVYPVVLGSDGIYTKSSAPSSASPSWLNQEE